MEINYEMIIKHLCKKPQNNSEKSKQEKNPFQTQKNIYTYANTWPEKFKELFTDKFYKYGVTVNDNEHNNISFWSSLLTLLDKSFIIPYDTDEITLITQFKSQLINAHSKFPVSEFIKAFDKNDIRERFKLNPEITTIQYVSDILDLNIWIFDFKTEQINIVYPKDIMNPWKQSVFLANWNLNWEPIMCVKSKGTVTRLFDYQHNIFKKLMGMDITYLSGETIGKEYIYYNNISDVIKLEKQNLKIKDLIFEEDSDSSVHTDDEDNTKYFVKADELEEIKKLNKTKINKMKVAELVELSKKLNITIGKKNPTKAVLMESILSKISNT
jgi:uncharacterized protein (UPF0216 family)